MNLGHFNPFCLTNFFNCYDVEGVDQNINPTTDPLAGFFSE